MFTHLKLRRASLFIKEIFESGLAIMLTRPSKFGKTLNLSLFRYFFDSTNDYSHLFANLAIWQHKKYRTLQGTIPVISISFKELTQDNYPSMLKKFSEILAGEYNRHTAILSNPNISPHDKKEFETFQTMSASEFDLEYGLEHLLRILNKHHTKNSILLIDDYDIPLHTAHKHGFYNEAFNFFKGLFITTFKDQPFLAKGILTGQLPIIMADMFSGLNNLDVKSITDQSLSTSFGFTSEEVERLQSSYQTQHTGNITSWYDGYMSGNTTQLYNPWSILSYLQNKGTYKQYWSNDATKDLLTKFLTNADSTTKSELASLISGATLEKPIEAMLDYQRINYEIWSILLYLGYLTYSAITTKKGKEVCSLVIPNHEIKLLLINHLTIST